MTEEQELTILGKAAKTRGHSGFGGSFWRRYHECAKRGTLSDALGGEPEDDEAFGLNAADVGTILHKLAEWWHSGKMTRTGITTVDGAQDCIRFIFPENTAINPNNPGVEEAMRVFRWYAHHYTPDFFGDVVGVEMPFAFTENDAHCPVGITPFTGRMDMVTKISESRAAKLTETLMTPIHPGIYIVDHKSKGGKPSAGQLQEFRESVQFHSYMMAWDVLFAAKYGPCQGTLANFMVRHKTEAKLRDGESFSQLLVPFPTPDQQQATRHWFRTALRRKMEEGDMHADANFCFNYGRACGHYLSGACKRY